MSSDKANSGIAVGSLTIGLPRSAALRFAFEGIWLRLVVGTGERHCRNRLGTEYVHDEAFGIGYGHGSGSSWGSSAGDDAAGGAIVGAAVSSTRVDRVRGWAKVRHEHELTWCGALRAFSSGRVHPVQLGAPPSPQFALDGVALGASCQASSYATGVGRCVAAVGGGLAPAVTTEQQHVGFDESGKCLYRVSCV
ncbi:hypothetical protein [Leucobacter aridicollis]|uniref:hypothetical protein n=1 Tax=Leucobacter aridicollis TaxID=283878 RepID=UPI002106E0C7|nr:hypothetical protein [Leucobacter aridicollis]UTX52913.1 hypothetical protein KI794_14540 [Leucobacter aridicollis]